MYLPVNAVISLVSGIVGLFKKKETNPYIATMNTCQQNMISLHDKIDKTFDREMDTDRDITEAVVKLKRLNFEVISHEERLEVISECLKVFARVKDRWTALIQFFEDMSRMLKTDLNKNLKAFLRQAKALADDSVLEEEEERLVRVPMAAASR